MSSKYMTEMRTKKRSMTESWPKQAADINRFDPECMQSNMIQNIQQYTDWVLDSWWTADIDL